MSSSTPRPRSRSRSSSSSSTSVPHVSEPIAQLRRSHKAATRPRHEAYTYCLLVVSSTLANDQLARCARRSRSLLLFFPLFTSVSLLIVLCLTRRPQSSQKEKDFTLSRALVREGHRGKRRRIWATGATFAGSLALKVWSMRPNDHMYQLQAIEVYVLPLLVLLSPSIASSAGLSSSRKDGNSQVFAAGMAFFVGLSLVGVPVAKTELALAILRLPLEAANLELLREGINSEEEDVRHEWMLGGAITACLLSLLLLPLAFLLPSHTLWPVFSPVAHLLSLSTLFIHTLYVVVLLFALRSFDDTIIPASHLVPRNIFELGWSTFLAGVSSLRGVRFQLLSLYLVGTGGVSKLVRDRRHDKTSNEEAIDSEPSTETAPSAFAYLSLTPLVFSLLHAFLSSSTPSLLAAACSPLPLPLRPTSCLSTSPALPSRTVDLVISCHNEDLRLTRSDLDYVRRINFVAERDSKVILYNKGDREESTLRKALGLKKWDEVRKLPNVGREGATYLHHILTEYNDTIAALSPSPKIPNSFSSLSSATPSRTGLAETTFFLQYHLAWTGVSKPRLWTIPSDVGFASFGPLHVSHCGEEPGTEHHPLLKTIYNMFTGKICPERNGILIAWSGQFIASRNRILANSYDQYAALSKIIEAPESNWIHTLRDPFGALGDPSNPAFGHVLERAWPTLFNCMDPKEFSQRCIGEKTGLFAGCYCRDK